MCGGGDCETQEHTTGGQTINRPPGHLTGTSQRASFAIIVILSLVVLGLAAPVSASPSPTPSPAVAVFPFGVASGDVTPVSAVLWTRVDRHALAIVEVATDSSFSPPVIRRTVMATWGHDFTAKVLVDPLLPDTVYHYRWRARGTLSEMGTFRTAPLPGHIPHPLRFGYSGDSDGTLVAGRPIFND